MKNGKIGSINFPKERSVKGQGRRGSTATTSNRSQKTWCRPHSLFVSLCCRNRRAGSMRSFVAPHLSVGISLLYVMYRRCMWKLKQPQAILCLGARLSLALSLLGCSHPLPPSLRVPIFRWCRPSLPATKSSILATTASSFVVIVISHSRRHGRSRRHHHRLMFFMLEEEEETKILLCPMSSVPLLLCELSAELVTKKRRRRRRRRRWWWWWWWTCRQAVLSPSFSPPSPLSLVRLNSSWLGNIGMMKAGRHQRMCMM